MGSMDEGWDETVDVNNVEFKVVGVPVKFLSIQREVVIPLLVTSVSFAWLVNQRKFLPWAINIDPLKFDHFMYLSRTPSVIWKSYILF